jgi:hypothetical protein
MTQMDARIAEFVARLTALERERAEIVAEIDTLQSARSGKTAAIKVVPSAIAGDPIDRNSAIEKRLLCFAGFSMAAQMSSPSVGRIALGAAAATHLPVRMNGGVGFAKNQKSNARHVQIRHSAPSKREVIIYDYVDMRVPVLARMATKRRIGYQAIGYEVVGTRDLFSQQAVTSRPPAEATLLSSRQ